MLQNAEGFYYEILCSQVDDPSNAEDISKLGRIDLNTNEIQWGFCFGSRGYVHTIETKDGMKLIQRNNQANKSPYGYMATKGNIVLDFQYDLATHFQEGYAVVSQNEEMRIIEKDGSYVFEPGTWQHLFRIHDRIFAGQTHSGKWYRFELPKSSKTPGKILISKDRVTIGYTDYGEPVLLIDAQKGSRSGGQTVSGCCMKTYLKKGDMIHVLDHLDFGLNLRKGPAGEKTGIQAFSKNNDGPIYFLVEDGPVCRDNKVWYKVNFIGHHGWIAEGENGEYYLEKR